MLYYIIILHNNIIYNIENNTDLIKIKKNS